MKRFVNETTLHCVKEVWYASRVGRFFWLVVFSCCFAFMVIQLKGVFEGYVSESVGTRTTYTSKGSVVEVPSIYYCSPRWKATPGALEELIRCSKRFENEMNSRSLSLVEQQMEFRERCYAAFTKASLSEELVNTIINPDWTESMYAKHYLSPKTCPQGYAKEMEKHYESHPILHRKLTQLETEVVEMTMQAFTDGVNQAKKHLENAIDETEEFFENGIQETTEHIKNRLAKANEHFETSIGAVKKIVKNAENLTDTAIAEGEAALAKTKEMLEGSIQGVRDTAAETKALIQGEIDAANTVVENTKTLAGEAIEIATQAVVDSAVRSQELIDSIDLNGMISSAVSAVETEITGANADVEAAKQKADDALRKIQQITLGLPGTLIGLSTAVVDGALSTGESVASGVAQTGKKTVKKTVKKVKSRFGRRKKRGAIMLNQFALRQVYSWIRELLDDIQSNYHGSLKEYIETKSLWSNGTDKIPAHGVVTMRTPSSVLASVDEKNLMDNYREGNVVLNMNGICWDVNQGAEPRTAQEVQVHEYTHYVLHFGALFYDLSVLAKDTETEGKEAKDYRFNLEDAIYFTTKEHPKASCDGDFRQPYNTDLFISPQNMPVPFFNNRVRMSGDQPFVHVKFSTKTTHSVNRKGYRCRHNWTKLDKAHCIEEKRWKEEWEPRCRQYLPASQHYSETRITNETCYHAPMKEIKEILKEHSPTTSSGSQAKEFFEQMVALAEQDTIVDWMKLYNADDSDCPPPCSETDYIITTTYSPADDGICNEVLGHVLLKDKYDSLSKEKNETRLRQKQRALEKFVKLNRKWSDPPRPCTRVTISQTEEKGFVSEEYPLHSFADVAANLGGTMGLWVGASVISFVQCLYFLCLERLLPTEKKIDGNEQLDK